MRYPSGQMSDAASEQRLQFLYELNRGLTGFSDLNDLVRFATQRTRELFRAEGCALIMLNDERTELYFPVVSDTDPHAEATVAQLRFPATQGLAGWVLEHDEAVAVRDASKDPRFYAGIDRQTAMKTKSMLCAPLRTPAGNVGVIEVINPAPDLLSESDLRFLETIAGDVAVACERTRVVAELRSEVTGLRQAQSVLGVSLILLGVLLIAGAVIRQLAWALPLINLLNTATFVAVGSVVSGALLFAIARGWLIGRAST